MEEMTHFFKMNWKAYWYWHRSVFCWWVYC